MSRTLSLIRRTFRCRADRSALYQLGVQKQRPDGNAVQQAGECVVGAAAELWPVLADTGQRGDGVGAEGQIVKSDDAQLVGHADAHLHAVDEDGVCQQVVAADDGGDALAEQPRQMVLQAFGGVVGVAYQGGLIRKAALTQRAEEGPVAHLMDIGPSAPLR